MLDALAQVHKSVLAHVDRVWWIGFLVLGLRFFPLFVWLSAVARGMGSPSVRLTGGGGPARVPNPRACKHLSDNRRWRAWGGNGELTPCRGTV